MTTLPERLRRTGSEIEKVPHPPGNHNGQACYDAAAEIERLQALLALREADLAILETALEEYDGEAQQVYDERRVTNAPYSEPEALVAARAVLARLRGTP